MLKQLIIFDMDGVLVDSEPAITYAAMETLAEYGISADYNDFKPYTGMGDDIFIGRVAEKYGLEYKTEMKRRAYEIYCETARKRVKVFPQSADTIRKLISDGYAVSVASASDTVKVRCNIDCIGIPYELFKAVITGSHVTRKKPAPDIFLKAAEVAGFTPSESIVVEDAVAGVAAAKAAGMSCVAVTTSFPSEKLSEADIITDGIGSVYDAVKQI